MLCSSGQFTAPEHFFFCTASSSILWARQDPVCLIEQENPLEGVVPEPLFTLTEKAANVRNAEAEVFYCCDVIDAREYHFREKADGRHANCVNAQFLSY